MIQRCQTHNGEHIRVTSVLPFGADIFGTEKEKDRWMKRGAAVHKATYYLDTVGLDWTSLSMPGYMNIEGYVRAWEKAKKEAGITIRESEYPIVNGRHGYCGTPDRIVKIGRKLGILDIKTGAPSPYTALQTAAYAEPLGLKYRWACHLRDDGNYRLEEYKGKSDFRIYLAYLTVARHQEKEGIDNE